MAVVSKWALEQGLKAIVSNWFQCINCGGWITKNRYSGLCYECDEDHKERGM